MANEADKSTLVKAHQKLSRLGSFYSKISISVKNGELTMAGVLTNEMHRLPLRKSMNTVAGVYSLVDMVEVIVPKKQH